MNKLAVCELLQLLYIFKHLDFEYIVKRPLVTDLENEIWYLLNLFF